MISFWRAPRTELAFYNASSPLKISRRLSTIPLRIHLNAQELRTFEVTRHKNLYIVSLYRNCFLQVERVTLQILSASSIEDCNQGLKIPSSPNARARGSGHSEGCDFCWRFFDRRSFASTVALCLQVRQHIKPPQD